MHFSIFLLASSISPLLSLASSHSGINSQKHVIDWISVKKRVMEGTSFKGTSNSNSKKMRNFGSVIEERSSSSNKSISSWSTESASIQGALDSTVSALVNQANNVANIIGNSTALLRLVFCFRFKFYILLLELMMSESNLDTNDMIILLVNHKMNQIGQIHQIIPLHIVQLQLKFQQLKQP